MSIIVGIWHYILIYHILSWYPFLVVSFSPSWMKLSYIFFQFDSSLHCQSSLPPWKGICNFLMGTHWLQCVISTMQTSA
jgi:hypothetical protein